MKITVWIIGALIVFEAVVLLIKPDYYRKFVKLLARGRLMYIPAALVIVFGVIFLVYARDCNIPWLIVVFGLIMLVKGVWLFATKIDNVRATMQWLQERSDTMLRILGILALAIGAVILYAGAAR
jgi:uncharacterized protein YjeT (DUF2065 family)